MIQTKIKEAIKKYSNELTDIRRKLHSEPELSWQEEKTTEFICQYLEQLGIAYRRTAPTGVIATIEGKKSGKTVALRGDMDALSVEELNKELSYVSKEEGKMHACGHDAHTAMLLIAAKVLQEMKDELPGNVRLIFQPAEEVAEGAKALVKQGAVDDVDNIFGIHIWSQMPTGKISCTPGPSFASADLFKVTFKGKGGHGAIPHDCIDTAIVASSFVMNVQTVVSRTIDAQHPAVLTIGKMVVGTRFNVIAENAVIEGTVRCFDPQTRDHIEKQLQHYADHVASLYGATARVEYTRGTQAVINDKYSADLVQKVAATAFGEESLFSEKPTMGGEDFSFYLDKVPGSFALVGSGNPKKDTQWAHHHGKFNIDEDALAIGAELYAQYAWVYLNE
ncbi:amidohydrolase [Heyndrickxia oleronia]|jgi:amidohydrolase|uniref:amidohydrolase n=1 Tax=Heyndrickxia oleronia TaxID=38875 RepID=UPI00242DEA23|nr:amidohydrolase [Heyndrickxia oleronia]MCI1589153.1 amidohydrolase [Heyndrickxia oleronia]MCI1611684.1 amidohydrolase [Heyndrickxia oleronia]MCI1743310.1 amidohydrolase [Heyndrickxia oleronia]MCI1760188.1 amidohydrolase [Heyndrickxia oleronia]